MSIRRNLIIIIILALSSFNVNAQTYLKENDEWTVYYMDGTNISSNYSSFLLGDTVVNNHKCHKYYEKVTGDTNFQGLVRDTLGKIFFGYIFLDFEEILIYDFNAKVGDTLESYNNYYQYFNYVPVINKIDTIELLDGESAKRFYVGGQDIWIEGVGSVHGFLHPIYPYISGYTSYLVCFQRNSILHYKNISALPPYTDPCPITNSINELKNTIKFKLYPNPTCNRIIIESDNIQENTRLLIHDMSGRLVFSKYLNDWSEYTCNLIAFENGIYLISLDSGFSIYRSLIIKH